MSVCLSTTKTQKVVVDNMTTHSSKDDTSPSLAHKK